LPVDSALLQLLVASAFLAAIWNGNADVLLASGRAHEFSLIFVVCCALTLLAAWILAKVYGVIGVAVAVLSCDALMALIVLRLVYRFATRSWKPS
jgi:O-antigen/teichoic acid export membrane protein